MKVNELLNEAAVSIDDIKIEDLGDNKYKVSVAATGGPLVAVLKSIVFGVKSNLKMTSKSGGKIDPFNFKGNGIILQGDKDVIMKLIASKIVSNKTKTAEKLKHAETAPQRAAEKSKANYALQKERQKALYDKYGKEVVDSVKIKSVRTDGDDGYQWAVYLNGRKYSSGLTQSQAASTQRSLWNEQTKKNRMVATMHSDPEIQKKLLAKLKAQNK